MDTMTILEQEIYPNLDRAGLLAELDPQRKRGYLLTTCPQCGKRDAFAYENGYHLECNRKNQCGFRVSLWDYVQNKGLSKQDTLKELAKHAGVTLPESNGENLEEIAKRHKKASALDNLLSVCQEELKGSTAAQTYLQSRGFSLEEAISLGMGFYPSLNTIKARIANITDITGTLSPIWENRIVGLWKTRGGRQTLWGRTIVNHDRKYHYLEGETKDSPFGLDTCREKDVTAVEGILDALSLRKYGLNDVVATGGSDLTQAQIESLQKARIQSVTLNLDNDKAGFDGLKRAIVKLESAGIRTYAVHPPLMGEGIKDPDQLIREKGIAAYRQLLLQAVSGAEWHLDRIVETEDLSTSKGIDNALFHGVAFLNKITNALTFEHCKKRLSSLLQIPIETVAHQCESATAKKAKEEILRDTQRLLTESQAKVNEGDQTILERLEEGAKSLRLKEAKIKAPPTLSLADQLKEKQEREAVRDPQTCLGLALTKFNRLQQNIDGVQPGFYIVGAETNIGKTAFLTNLFLDLLDTNPKAKGLYFSLDDSVDVILNRFLAIKTDLQLNSIQKRQANAEDQQKVSDAYSALLDLNKSGRLELKDIAEVNHIDVLEREIRERADENLFVFIDGLYNLDVGSKHAGLREENIDRANRIKRLVDTYKIPIITTGELRKKQSAEGANKKPDINDLMETGKFAYNANLVLLLYSKDRDKFKEEDAPLLALDYEKNKLSHYRGCQEIRFFKSKSIIEEVDFKGFDN